MRNPQDNKEFFCTLCKSIVKKEKDVVEQQKISKPPTNSSSSPSSTTNSSVVKNATINNNFTVTTTENDESTNKQRIQRARSALLIKFDELVTQIEQPQNDVIHLANLFKALECCESALGQL